MTPALSAAAGNIVSNVLDVFAHKLGYENAEAARSALGVTANDYANMAKDNAWGMVGLGVGTVFLTVFLVRYLVRRDMQQLLTTPEFKQLLKTAQRLDVLMQTLNGASMTQDQAKIFLAMIAQLQQERSQLQGPPTPQQNGDTATAHTQFPANVQAQIDARTAKIKGLEQLLPQQLVEAFNEYFDFVRNHHCPDRLGLLGEVDRTASDNSLFNAVVLQLTRALQVVETQTSVMTITDAATQRLTNNLSSTTQHLWAQLQQQWHGLPQVGGALIQGQRANFTGLMEQLNQRITREIQPLHEWGNSTATLLALRDLMQQANQQTTRSAAVNQLFPQQHAAAQQPVAARQTPSTEEIQPLAALLRELAMLLAQPPQVVQHNFVDRTAWNQLNAANQQSLRAQLQTLGLLTPQEALANNAIFLARAENLITTRRQQAPLLRLQRFATDSISMAGTAAARSIEEGSLVQNLMDAGVATTADAARTVLRRIPVVSWFVAAPQTRESTA